MFLLNSPLIVDQRTLLIHGDHTPLNQGLAWDSLIASIIAYMSTLSVRP